MHQPGEDWMYNSGLQVLGVLIERARGDRWRRSCASGVRAVEHGRHEFSVPRAKLDRFTTAYAPDAVKPANCVCSIGQGRLVESTAADAERGRLAGLDDRRLLVVRAPRARRWCSRRPAIGVGVTPEGNGARSVDARGQRWLRHRASFAVSTAVGVTVSHSGRRRRRHRRALGIRVGRWHRARGGDLTRREGSPASCSPNAAMTSPEPPQVAIRLLERCLLGHPALTVARAMISATTSVLASA